MIETNPQKICQALIRDVVITPQYNASTNTTTFSFEFPSWLHKNYSPETVTNLINIITPIIVDEMNESVDKKCYKVIKENC